MEPPFVLFGKTHIAALILIITAIPLLSAFFHRCQSYDRIMRFSLVVFLFSLECYLPFFSYYKLRLDWQQSLPLNMCDFSRIFLGLYLIFGHKVLFDVGYFWGMSGSIVALAFPDLKHGFPSPEFICFYTTHIIILIIIAYVITIDKYVPSLKGLLKASCFALTMLFPILFANFMIGKPANYWYLITLPNSVNLIKQYVHNLAEQIIIMVLLGQLSFCIIYFSSKIIMSIIGRKFQNNLTAEENSHDKLQYYSWKGFTSRIFVKPGGADKTK